MFGGGKQNPEHVKAELLNIELKLSQTESKIASLQERQRRAVELMGQLGPLGTQLAQKGAALQNMVSRGGNVRQLNAEIGDIQSQMNALRMRMSAHLGDFKTVEGIADHLKTLEAKMEDLAAKGKRKAEQLITLGEALPSRLLVLSRHHGWK